MPVAADPIAVAVEPAPVAVEPVPVAAEPASAAEPIPVEEARDEPEPAPIPDDLDEVPLAAVELDESAGLADRLWAARENAEAARQCEARSREAL